MFSWITTTVQQFFPTLSKLHSQINIQLDIDVFIADFGLARVLKGEVDITSSNFGPVRVRHNLLEERQLNSSHRTPPPVDGPRGNDETRIQRGLRRFLLWCIAMVRTIKKKIQRHHLCTEQGNGYPEGAMARSGSLTNHHCRCSEEHTLEG